MARLGLIASFFLEVEGLEANRRHKLPLLHLCLPQCSAFPLPRVFLAMVNLIHNHLGTRPHSPFPSHLTTQTMISPYIPLISISCPKGDAISYSYLSSHLA